MQVGFNAGLLASNIAAMIVTSQVSSRQRAATTAHSNALHSLCCIVL